MALWIFFGAVALRLLVPADGTLRSILDGIGVAALAWWAVDEVLRGVNPWRRLLGGAGCIAAGLGLVALLR